MADVPDQPRNHVDSLPTLGELPLSAERQAVLAPKLQAVLAQLCQIEEMELTELEPAPAKPERWDDDERC
jgi:hypothetical protein